MALIASVVALSGVSAAISEDTRLHDAGLAWMLVYRTEEYKALAQTADRQTKKLDKKKESASTAAATPKKDRKLDRVEEQLKATSRDISRMQFKSTLAVGIVMAFMFAVLSSAFEGRVVAKLPFQPVSLIAAVSHRDLLGNDLTDCSAFFIYVLASMAIRPVVQRYFNLGIKIKGQDFLSLMTAQANKSSGSGAAW